MDRDGNASDRAGNIQEGEREEKDSPAWAKEGQDADDRRPCCWDAWVAGCPPAEA